MTDSTPAASESERLLRFLYVCPVGLVDFSGTGEVRMMNALAVQMLMPIGRGEHLDNFFRVLEPLAPDLPQLTHSFAEPSGTVLEDRRLSLTAGGTTRHYSLKIMRVEGDTYMAALMDVTQAVTNEEIAREALQAEAVQEGRVDVLTSVLHDIGNGITGIGTRTATLVAAGGWPELDQFAKLAGFLKQRQPQLESALGADKSKALLDFVETVGSRLRDRANLWRDTLAFFSNAIAHVQDIIALQRQFIRGGGGSARVKLAVTDLLDDALAIQRASLEKRGIRITHHYAPHLPEIDGDRTRLIQVFINTLKNVGEAFDALEEMPGAKRERILRISALRPAADRIEITFTDNACGFAAPGGVLPVSRGTTTKSSGSGIGLHASAQIIAAHHGTLNVSSAGPGLGATCSIVLSLPPPADNPSP